MNKNKKGFTLVEVIVVLVILAILIAIAVPSVMKYIDDANDAKILVQARPVLLTSKSESAKLYAEGLLETLPNDTNIHKRIIEIADIDGELISIELNKSKTASGDFIVKIQDKYIYYNDIKESFEFIEKSNAINIFERINNALLEDNAKNIILNYFKNHPNSKNIDSEGPNFGTKIKEELEKLGFNSDNYSFRIWSEATSNTITIGTPKLTLDMVGQEVEVTRYDYGTSKDFSSKPKVYTATVIVTKSAAEVGNTSETVEFATYKLSDVEWIEKKQHFKFGYKIRDFKSIV